MLRHEDPIVKKPCVDDGSSIVAGHANQIYCATPGKGGPFNCDWNCVNASAKICEHTIAVAEKYGKLPDFITWYKRSKSGVSITKMAYRKLHQKLLEKSLELKKDRIAKDHLQFCM